jgi:hypothetical protein
MKSRLAVLAMVSLFGAVVSTPAQAQSQQPSQNEQHDQHHPGTAAEPARPATPGPQANMMDMMSRMKAGDAKLEALVTKMNAATGAAKTDAIAELLTALVQDRRNMCGPMMANMMSMMNMMGSAGGHGANAPATPRK